MLLDGRKLGLSDRFLVTVVGFLLGIDEGGSDWFLKYLTLPPHTQYASDTVSIHVVHNLRDGSFVLLQKITSVKTWLLTGINDVKSICLGLIMVLEIRLAIGGFCKHACDTSWQ